MSMAPEFGPIVVYGGLLELAESSLPIMRLGFLLDMQFLSFN
jgi:hypothetical protein